ncbi:MAG: hypothetical protein HUJ16_12725 [Kangiella sp.]|nr:hypothetical protein [Kangiella sp.]
MNKKNEPKQSDGSLVCVGLGMTLGAHITPASQKQIETADIVFIGASSGIVEEWVKSINPNIISLQPYYQGRNSRKDTYAEMIEAILGQVRLGKKVCGAFYGHPGVFALAPRKAIQRAREEGYAAYMEPGISAEACLYADLGLDPGATGCQQFETNQFMFYNRQLDTASLLILWQVGLAGDKDSKNFSTTKENLQKLVDILFQHYPPEHNVIIYEAKLLAIDAVREEVVMLKALPDSKLSMNSTLVIPPYKRLIDLRR